MKNLKYIVLLLNVLLLISCSDENESEEIPVYAGTWERSWQDEGTLIGLTETLDIRKDNLSAEIQRIEEEGTTAHLAYKGNIEVIDNTLTVWITQVGLAENSNSYKFFEPGDEDFENLVLNNLNRPVQYAGVFFREANTLTMMIDADGDGNVSNGEGTFIYNLRE